MHLVREPRAIWGIRGPTYPTMLALLYTVAGGRDDRLVVAVQVILGAVGSGLLLALGWLALRSPWIGMLLGLSYALSVELAVWERSILADTLTILLVLLAMTGGALLLRTRRPPVWQLCALGLLLGVLALCRHYFAGYWLAIAVVLAIVQSGLVDPSGGPALRDGVRRFARTLAWVSVVPLTLVLLWSASNWIGSGWFTFSTLAGSNLSRVATMIFEHAPGSTCQRLAPVWVAQREALLAVGRRPTGTTFVAREALRSASGNLSEIELERTLATCALGAILARPEGYLQAVGASAGEFWHYADYTLNPPIVGSNLELAEAGAMRLPWLRIAFLLSTLEIVPALLLLRHSARKRAAQPVARPDALTGVALLVLATAWYGFVVGSSAEWGDSYRSSTAVHPAIVASVVLSNALLLRALFPTVRSWRSAGYSLGPLR